MYCKDWKLEVKNLIVVFGSSTANWQLLKKGKEVVEDEILFLIEAAHHPSFSLLGATAWLVNEPSFCMKLLFFC